MDPKKLAFARIALVILLLGSVVAFGTSQTGYASVGGGLANPGFEDGLKLPWTVGTAPDRVVVVGAQGSSQFPVYAPLTETTVQPWQGSKMVGLGTPKLSCESQETGQNSVEQTFAPADDTLYFAFRLFSWEYRGSDLFSFDLKARRAGKGNGWQDSVGTVTDLNGGPLIITMRDGKTVNLSTQPRRWTLDVGNQGDFLDTGWVVVKISNVPVDQELRLTFSVGGTSDRANATWAYFDGGNRLPVAKFEFSSLQPMEGEFVGFMDLSYDLDPGDAIVSWLWTLDWGSEIDSASSDWRNPFFIPPNQGTYDVSLTVTDSHGMSNTVHSGEFSSDRWLHVPNDGLPIPELVVGNAPPKVNALNIETLLGEEATIVGRFLDTGWDDNHVATWSVGLPQEPNAALQEDHFPYVGTGVVVGRVSTRTDLTGTLRVDDFDRGYPADVATFQDTFDVKVVDSDPNSREPNNTVDDAPKLASDGVYLSYLAEGDIDLFEVVLPDGQPLPAGTEILITLEGLPRNGELLPADYDLVVLREQPAGLESAAFTTLPWTKSPWTKSPWTKSPFDQYPLSQVGFTGFGGDEIRETDISLSELGLGSVGGDNLEVIGFSANHGLDKEVVLTRCQTAGTSVFVGVLGYNGAFRDNEPYSLQVETSVPLDFSEVIDDWPYEVPVNNEDFDRLPHSYPGGEPQTLFVTQQERLAGLCESESEWDELLDRLIELADSDNIRGDIISVPSDAYQQWISDPSSVDAANSVAAVIRSVIQENLTFKASIRYVVIVGSDDVIPYRRVPDVTIVGNESSYAISSLLRPGSPLFSSVLQGYILSDDYFGERPSTASQSRLLQVPDLAVGRLVETPQEIMATAAAFLESNGVLNPASALVTGHDFFNDGAQAIVDILKAAGLADMDINTLIGNIGGPWTADQLRSAFLGDAHDINNLNAHFTHYAALSAYGFENDVDDVVTSDEIRDAEGSLLENRLVFSMGCHAGLNVPDQAALEAADTGLDFNSSLDLPQAMAAQRAIYVASTGYGLGDDKGIGGTERLMGVFAQELLQSDETVGDALVAAKQRYLSALSTVTPYDQKSSIQFALYGLPQYRINEIGVAPGVNLSAPSQSTDTIDANGYTGSLTIEDGSASNTYTYNLEPVDPPSGWYFTARLASTDYRDYQPTPFRFVEPRIVIPLGLGGDTPVRGVVVKSAQFIDIGNFDPVTVLPRTEWDVGALEPQIAFSNFWPSTLAFVNSWEVNGQLEQALVIVLGQFRATSGTPNVTGNQRLYTDLTIELQRPIPETAADVQPPTIESVNLGIDEATDNMAVTVVASDDSSGIARIEAVIMHEDGGTTSHPFLPELTPPYPTSGQFTILVPDLGLNDGLLVQVIDGAGNVAECTGKGAPTVGDWDRWIPMPGFTDSALYGVWANSSDDVFAVGELGPGESGTILHYDGSSWSAMASGTPNVLNGVWGSSATDVFAVGSSMDDNFTILHYNGTSWSDMIGWPPHEPNNWWGVWGSSATNVFAVGYSGIILHYDGSTWSPVSETLWDLHGVWGSSATDVFAVGYGGTIMHYSGSAWSMMTSETELDLRAVWGSSSSNVFAVGGNGTILHYDGNEDGVWSSMPSGTANGLTGIWGSSSSNVFAVGDNGTILHYDGSTWTPMNCGSQDNFQAVSGTASDVFAVGENGTIWHYAIPGYEKAWMATYDGPASGTDVAWATAVDELGNVYVAGWSEGIGTGEDYLTIKYDSTGEAQWTARYDSGEEGYGDRAYAIAVDGSGNVYVTGYSETSATAEDYLTIKYDSAGEEQWTARYDGPANDFDGAYGMALYEDGYGDVYVYVTGTSMGAGTEGDYATIKYDGDTGNEVWGEVARYDGPAHGHDYPGFAGMYGPYPCQPIAVDDLGNAYVTGQSQSSVASIDFDYATVKYQSDNGTQLWAKRYDGLANGWDVATSIAVDRLGNTYVTGISEQSVSYAYLVDVWGSSGSDVFAVGDYSGFYSGFGVIAHYDGSRWSYVYSYTPGRCAGIWGNSSSDVFAVGWDGTIQRYDGTTWASMSSGTTTPLYDIWGSSSSDVFAVGWGGTMLHYDGTIWSSMTSGTTNSLRGIWGSSSDNVAYAVGDGGTILQYKDGAWSPMTSGTTDALAGIWGSSSSDVFVVGYDGTILHYDGTTWSSMTSGTTDDLSGIWGSSSDNVAYAVGDGGTILQYKDGAWSPMTSGTTDGLSGIWGSSSDNVFAVGIRGTILHYDGSAWTEMSTSQGCTTVKYDSNGDFVWDRTYSSPGHGDTSYGWAVALDDWGNVYVAGGTSLNGVNSDYLTTKYDSDGTQDWVRTYKGPGDGLDYVWAMAVDEWGNVYVTGESSSISGVRDCATVGYDSDGNEIWVSRYNGPVIIGDDDIGYCVAVDQWGGVYVAGVTGGEGIWYGDCFVIRYVPTIQ